MRAVVLTMALLAMLAGCAGDTGWQEEGFSQADLANCLAEDPDAPSIRAEEYGAYYFLIDEDNFFVTVNKENAARHSLPGIQPPALAHLRGGVFTAISHVNPNLESLYVLDAEKHTLEEYHGLYFLWDEAEENIYYVTPPAHFTQTGPSTIFQNLEPLYRTNEDEAVYSIEWNTKRTALLAQIGPALGGEEQERGPERTQEIPLPAL